MAGRLAGKIAIITGSGQGIGKGIALRFGAEGAKVVVATRSDNGKDVEKLIREAGGEATYIKSDIGTKDACFKLLADTEKVYGGVDIVLHNAGDFTYSSVEELPEDAMERMLTINLKACFWLTQASLPLLRKSKSPRILFTSSVSGNSDNARGLAVYSAAKAGVNGYVRNLALDLAREGITVNCVEPGYIVTEKLAIPEMAEYVNAAVSKIPINRRGTPADIAAPFVYFASEEASYCTGQSLVIDGGLTLTDCVDFGNAPTGAHEQ